METRQGPFPECLHNMASKGMCPGGPGLTPRILAAKRISRFKGFSIHVVRPRVNLLPRWLSEIIENLYTCLVVMRSAVNNV